MGLHVGSTYLKTLVPSQVLSSPPPLLLLFCTGCICFASSLHRSRILPVEQSPWVPPFPALPPHHPSFTSHNSGFPLFLIIDAPSSILSRLSLFFVHHNVAFGCPPLHHLPKHLPKQIHICASVFLQNHLPTNLATNLYTAQHPRHTSQIHGSLCLRPSIQPLQSSIKPPHLDKQAAAEILLFTFPLPALAASVSAIESLTPIPGRQAYEGIETISPLLLVADHTRPITAPFLPTPLAQHSSPPILLSVAFCPTHFCYVFAGTRPPLASILIAAQVQAQGFFFTLCSSIACCRNHRLLSIYRLWRLSHHHTRAREGSLDTPTLAGGPCFTHKRVDLFLSSHHSLSTTLQRRSSPQNPPKNPLKTCFIRCYVPLLDSIPIQTCHTFYN
ncbi:uncharacterized protein CLUP02_18005 [Colletotrichum lupini]|uniref:Uncharacterized protein n=1 Tax=Colletotrichum lupini TaxID=145971 RepID=A0A9Q8WBB2_9PEZI|nr:uncharacterized protein CLUP02_18005 [Colletotrichum lupini]UQC76492.1 hypothetical protein CLUP02_18005 [Colletotrichum lupini]